ncbi:MAG: hypothetical protein Q8K12_13065 [Thiobacillus sp.]|nr:hypothetical protein [Thiobacillus sp.]
MSQNDQDMQRILRWLGDPAKVRSKLVQRKKILPADEFAAAMGVSRESLGKLVATRGLFALEVAGEIYYPAFYLQLDSDRKKYERVVKALGGISGWSKWDFFTRPKGFLGDKTPLQALKDKDSLAAVVTSAIGFAEQR